MKPHTPEQSRVKGEIKREIEKYLETNENGNTMPQNLEDSVKPLLRRKFIVCTCTNAYIKERERSQIYNLTDT